jgi:hypothetical protein
MKRVGLLVLVLLAGCATMTYRSQRPASDVAHCIADGWRHAPPSGYPMPVSVSETSEYTLIAAELLPIISPIVLTMGLRHPGHAIWAEVSPTSDGSSTRYHRAYQFAHRIIDGVVVDCQGNHAPERGSADEVAPNEEGQPR